MSEVKTEGVTAPLWWAVSVLAGLAILAYLLFPQEYFYGKIVHKSKTANGNYLLVVYNYPNVYRATSSDDFLEVLPVGQCLVMRGYKDPNWGLIVNVDGSRNPKEYFRAKVIKPTPCEIK